MLLVVSLSFHLVDSQEQEKENDKAELKFRSSVENPGVGLAIMSSGIPHGLVQINNAMSRLNAEVNLMAVVTDFLPPCLSRGTDWMSTFSITDMSYAGICDDGLKVRFFRPEATQMPAIRGTGDVVLLRGIKIKEWRGMTVGLSTRGTSWVVFPADSIPTKAPVSAPQLKNVKEPRGLAPTIPEMQYAISLCNSRDRSTFTAPSLPPIGSAGAPMPLDVPSTAQWKDKFSLVKNVKVESFYDLVGQVVKLYPSNGRSELYLTVNTGDTLLWNYPEPDDGYGSGREGDEYNYVAGSPSKQKWDGPYGKLTLTVTLWGNNASFSQQHVKENDFVHLRNVHIKWSKDGKVEGVLHSDRRNPDRIDVTVLKNYEDEDRVKDVLRRKRDYWKKWNHKMEGVAHQTKALKRKAREDEKPLSKNQVRKRRKHEREHLAKSMKQGEDSQSDKENEEEEDINHHLRKKQALNHRSPLPKQELNSNGKQSLLPRRTLADYRPTSPMRTPSRTPTACVVHHLAR